MKKRRKQKKQNKGVMARKLVYFCISILTITLIWAMVLKTIAFFNSQMSIDVSDVLTFAAAAFGGELLFLAFKRIFAKPNKQEGEDSYDQNYSEIDES
jgi:uncharacterized membrane protein